MNTLSVCLASISGGDLLTAGLWLVAAAVIYFVATWAIGEIKPAEPFNKILRVLIVLAAAVFVIYEVVTLAQKA